MRRRLIAAVWIAGATLPLLMATAMAADIVRGEREHDAAPQSPARGKQEPVKRIATAVPPTFRLGTRGVVHDAVTPTAIAAYRSFISLGAVRCDRDVGLHVLVDTYRI